CHDQVPSGPDELLRGDPAVPLLQPRVGQAVAGAGRLPVAGAHRVRGWRFGAVSDHEPSLRAVEPQLDAEVGGGGDMRASMRDLCLLYGDEFHRAWGAPHAISTGRPAFDEVFGAPLQAYLRSRTSASDKFQRA
ncbi:MAG TPA: hypothetical protein VLW53_22720, partial [Candidatus Eisenbacteria bacterium]|nr:hypothetical protein [Candidatus Eisenbacteria bacterium]